MNNERKVATQMKESGSGERAVQQHAERDDTLSDPLQDPLQKQEEEEEIQMSRETEEDEEQVQLQEEEEIQMAAEAGGGSVHQAAEAGFQGGGGQLPHSGQIQASFGSHDVSGVKAYSGGAAAQASKAMGAKAYTKGEQVGFKGSTDLHTAAHEAAHVVQQRQGVSLDGGVGKSGDSYEKHANAVADAVVQGKSAEGMLSGGAGKKRK